MFDHVGFRVSHLETSVRFYETALAALGCALGYRDESVAGFGPPGAPALWLHASEAAGGCGMHAAFRAKDRAAVRAFHAAGLSAGGRENGPPGPREAYGPTYYAAFLLDPDGNNVEAVCLAAED